MASPVIIDSSTELPPSISGTIDGNLFSGTDAHAIADLDVCQRDIDFLPVAQHAGGGRSQRE